jgi:hypothetical protein
MRALAWRNKCSPAGFDHALQQGHCLDGAKLPAGECIGQGIDLERQFAERIFG